MFFVIDKRDNEFGVVDTEDGVIEYFDKETLSGSGLNIVGFNIVPLPSNLIEPVRNELYDKSNREIYKIISRVMPSYARGLGAEFVGEDGLRYEDVGRENPGNPYDENVKRCVNNAIRHIEKSCNIRLGYIDTDGSNLCNFYIRYVFEYKGRHILSKDNEVLSWCLANATTVDEPVFDCFKIIDKTKFVKVWELMLRDGFANYAQFPYLHLAYVLFGQNELKTTR